MMDVLKELITLAKNDPLSFGVIAFLILQWFRSRGEDRTAEGQKALINALVASTSSLTVITQKLSDHDSRVDARLDRTTAAIREAITAVDEKIATAAQVRTDMLAKLQETVDTIPKKTADMVERRMLADWRDAGAKLTTLLDKVQSISDAAARVLADWSALGMRLQELWRAQAVPTVEPGETTPPVPEMKEPKES